LYAWEFEKGGRELRVRVEGQLTYNTTAQMLNAAQPDWAWFIQVTISIIRAADNRWPPLRVRRCAALPTLTTRSHANYLGRLSKTSFATGSAEKALGQPT
jgi:hypothetical protein